MPSCLILLSILAAIFSAFLILIFLVPVLLYLNIPALAFEFRNFVGFVVRKIRIASAKPFAELVDFDEPHVSSIDNKLFLRPIISSALYVFRYANRIWHNYAILGIKFDLIGSVR